MNILAQIAGALAFIILAISLQRKKKAKILIYQAFANIFFIVQFLLLKAFSGLSINALNLCKSIIYYVYDKKGKKSSVILVVLLSIASIICVTITYEGIVSVLPIIPFIMSTISVYKNNTKWIRISETVACIIWIVYNASVGAYVGVIANIVIFISSIIGILRHDMKKTLSE